MILSEWAGLWLWWKWLCVTSEARSLKDTASTWLFLTLWMLAIETQPLCYEEAPTSPNGEIHMEKDQGPQLTVQYEWESWEEYRNKSLSSLPGSANTKGSRDELLPLSPGQLQIHEQNKC